MAGSVSVGKDVLNMMSQHLQDIYLKNGLSIDYRRSGSDPDPRRAFATLLAITGETKTIRGTVIIEDVCKGITFCQEPRKADFLADYVSTLGNAVDTILASVLVQQGDEYVPESIFKPVLRNVLNEVHKIINHADTNAVEKMLVKREAHEWVNVIKRISAIVLEQALGIVHEKLSGDTPNERIVRKKLIQKLVISIIIVENVYENRLCTHVDMCVQEYFVTENLRNFLDNFNYTTEQRAKEFIEYFYESIPEDFYSIIEEKTAQQLQFTFSEISYSTSVSTKDILLSVLKIVEARQDNLKTHNNMTITGFDSQLVNIILSDMDHIYFEMNSKKSPFEDFMAVFSKWLKTGGRLRAYIRPVVKQMHKTILSAPKELVSKLSHEVRVFLELTVDPENN